MPNATSSPNCENDLRTGDHRGLTLAWGPVCAPHVLNGPLPGALSRPPTLRERWKEHNRQGCGLLRIRSQKTIPQREVLYYAPNPLLLQPIIQRPKIRTRGPITQALP